MGNLFSRAVTFITEKYTGLEHDNLRLLDLPTYIRVSDQVGMVLNILCLLIVVFIGICVIESIVYKVRDDK